MKMAGVLASTRAMSAKRVKDLKIMFLGAGSAASRYWRSPGASLLIAEGLSEKDARERLWIVDLEGLIVKSRQDLAPA